MNKSRHLSVDFCRETKAAKLVNSGLFMSLEEFDGGFFEVMLKIPIWVIFPV